MLDQGEGLEFMVDDPRIMLRLAQDKSAEPSAIVLDSRSIQSSPESGSRAGYDGHKRRRLQDAHGRGYARVLALLACAAANEQERAQVATLAQEVQEITGQNVTLAIVDQGYTGGETAQAAAKHGIQLKVVKHTEAKRGFVLLPRRWVVERSFAWAARFRRSARDYERIPETLAGLHFVAFAILTLTRALPLVQK